jgi:cytochrome c biogenesis protein CcmG/thiol:disulfide interchange protein DsbE
MLTKSRNRSIALISFITLTGTALGMGALLGPSIEREGDADHVSVMRDLEGQSFDTALFDGLSNWTHNKALNASNIEGKVVLVGIVDSSSSQSMLMLSTLARYERQNGDDGLVVLAVHPELGWDAIAEKVNAGRVKVQAAMDTGGNLASSLGTDDTPDLYLIDRAGQLRYADIESKSLKIAVRGLLRESVDEAVANAKLEAEGIEVAAVEETKADAPKVIPAEAYAHANWPSHNSGRLTANNFQGQQLPAKLGNEQWLSEEKDLTNKVIILDFWATWCGPCRAASPKLEEIQREYEGRVEVLAIGGASDDERNHKRYVYANKKAYSNLYDKRDTINNAIDVKAIPHTVVMSTDGVVRWQGNPLAGNFKDIVAQVVNADPMFDDSITSSDATSDSTSDSTSALPAEAYADANWPTQNRGELYAANNQGNKLPAPLGNEKWLTEKVSTQGKVVMLDFWATWCPPCREFSPIADRLQQKYQDKLQILAISGQNDPEANVKKYINEHSVSYAHLYDGSLKVHKALKIQGIPHVVIMSTDGVIRWQGFPLDPNFESALEQIISNDPLVNQ